MERLGVIYKATCLITGKSYIGQTIKSLEERKREHYKAKDNFPFHLALKKYGPENFNWEILEDKILPQDLDEKEIYWIEFYNTYCQGYNATRGGDNTQNLDNWREKNPDKVLENAKNGLLYAQKYNKEHREEHLANLAKARPLALAARRRKVRCIELDLEFESLSAAEEWSKTIDNPNKQIANHQHISKVCRGQRHTAGGYHWQYIL